jgi:hypothetical protein
LPEEGEPVVCRFDNGGQEVIAEGVVAWRQKASRGGEFGVRFTALDARSAEALKIFCGLDPVGTTPFEATVEAAPQKARRVTAGSKVKLHIEGLGAPMRARVDEGKGSRIAVASTLEFLKMGRKLEMESVDDGTRREARIDGLDVTIDPSTGIPRLLVLLKTDSDENTPEPSVVDARKKEKRSISATEASSSREKVSNANVAVKSEKAIQPEKAATASQEEIDAQVEIMVGRMRRIAGSARRKMSEVSGQLGERIGPTMGRAFQSMRQFSRRSAEPARRKTAPPPSTGAANADRKLRPQNRSAQASEPEVTVTPKFLQPKYKRTAGAVVAVGLLATVIAVAARSPEPVRSTASPELLAPESAAAAAPLGNPTVVVGPASATKADGNGSVMAPVPLFGPTALATLEPAPLPAKGNETDEAVAARELALAKATQAAVASGADPSLSEEPSPLPNEEPSTKPEDVAPWGKGKMKDPTIYRIKLDEAGSALKGTNQSQGFSVIVPGRKAMESPKGFVSKDPRFSKISAQNTSDGVKITWTFKSEVPAYRVRLRKTNVEVLISESVKSSKPE